MINDLLPRPHKISCVKLFISIQLYEIPMDIVVTKWLERVTYDLATAQSLRERGHDLYVAFLCQQAAEKVLKAYLCHLRLTPPFVHNLLRLAESASLFSKLPPEFQTLLANLNPFYIKARYGEYKGSLAKICTAEKATHFLQHTKEFVTWLTAQIK